MSISHGYKRIFVNNSKTEGAFEFSQRFYEGFPKSTTPRAGDEMEHQLRV